MAVVATVVVMIVVLVEIIITVVVVMAVRENTTVYSALSVVWPDGRTELS